MDGKTSKPAFNTEAKKEPEKPKSKRNYSHWTLLEKTDLYASMAKTGQQQKEMLDIKDEYLADKNKKTVNRVAQHFNLAMGIRAGIHARGAIERSEEYNKNIDQHKINQTMKKAKTYYHRNYSLSKTFKGSKEKTKDRGMDKSKGQTMDRG